ncbi:carbohydrate-binding protein [Neotamlana laminarinivorans]|uniref:Carbohydrate-binding protein n=1 Tax=Neotamlana laminarinivorans TaxID=2883124 RepID=A0A9X1I449_9FLAO|nr:carbohydrate-binding protein [Tamlana laminarinivorans]MCB4799644.1 carbohydrate-binding protein [Tamlana laminarinivorans]
MRNITQLILCLMLLIAAKSGAQTTINSLAELKDRLDEDNGNFVMTPGTYYFNTSNCGEGKLFDDPRLLLFTGNNSTFDFTDVKFEIDTEIFTLYGNVDIIEFWPVGSNNTYKNLTLEDIGMTVPTKGAGTLHLDGADNLIEGFKTTTRGSFPYGYGDTFGKGGGSVIAHNKHAGMLVRGDRNHLKNCTVIMRAYGHGIFVQGSHDAIIEGCYVEGELRTVGEMLQEEGTDSPADNVDFETVWDFNLKDHTSDYTFSLQEAGIRAYSNGVVYDSEGNPTDETARQTLNTTVIDCTIVKMRVGVNTGAEGGDNKRIENCTALACEGGFWLGNDGDVINCFADASVGPILSEDIHRSNATYEVTILDNYIPKIGNTPYFFAGGTNHNITIHDGTTYYNPDIQIVLGGHRYANRFLTGSVEPPPSRSAENITFTNNTKYPVILETATNCDIYSCGPVTDNGSGNTITTLTTCDYIRPCDNRADNLQAECYDNMLSIGTQDIAGDTNEREVYGINSGDWISFSSIDLTNMASVTVKASGTKDNVSLQVRQGSATGTLLATIPISSTGNYLTYQEYSANLNQTITGTTDLYFVANSPSDTGWLFNIDVIKFVEDPCTTSYNPFFRLSAEDYCDGNGVTIENLSIFNDVVSDIENTDYIKFSNVDFGYDDVYNAIEILASATSNGKVEVRSGAVDGTLLATISVESTGDWNTYDVFKSYTSSELTGIHDIYFVFTEGTGTWLKFDNFYFQNDECFGVSYDAYTQIDALSYCGMLGVIPINDEYLGGIHDGDWIRYSNVDFTSTSPAEITLNLAGLSTTSGYINVMLSHPYDGTMIATATVPQTGGWEVWQEVTVPLNQEVTGIHDVYIYFGNNEFNIDWFEFHAETEESINLALASNGGIASQSSTAYEGEASRANDGNTDGNFGGNSVTHTEHGADGVLKWWQVDLGADKTINEIKVYGRTGSNYIDDLNNFTVEIINANGDVTFSQFYATYPSSRPLTIDVGTTVGKIVKISKTSNRAISLAEVEVYGSNTLGTNSKTLNQIKLYPNPATNIITIGNAINTKVEVYNLQGILELQFIINKNEHNLSLQQLNKGIHFLRFKNTQGTLVKKLIKN